MEHMWDLIETDKLGNAHYNKNTLNLILRSLHDEQLLKSLDTSICVGVSRLSTYIYYFNKLKEYFELGKDIIELGFGEFPIMSFLIDHEQTILNNGSVNAYDGSTINYNEIELSPSWQTGIASLGNINFHFQNIGYSTVLPHYDLIIGIHACNGLINLIQKANQDKKDFFLAICDCYETQWFINLLYNLAKEGTNKDSELFIDHANDKHLPILVRKRK